MCTLRQTVQEGTLHMITKCDYSKTVWQQMAREGNFQLPHLQNVNRVLPWWELLKTATLNQTQTREQHMQLITYTAWNI
jgi:hypothetical protein